MSSNNYKIHGNKEAVWARIESEGCKRADGIALMDIEPDPEYAVRLAKGVIYDREKKIKYGTGGKKEIFSVHTSDGFRVDLHHTRLTEAQRKEAARDIHARILADGSSGKRVLKKNRFARLMLLLQYSLPFEEKKEATS
jgi:hypothetical protein